MLTFQPATEQERARLASASSRLREYSIACAALLSGFLTDPSPDCQLRKAEAREGGRWAYDAAALQISGAQDHLLAVAGLLGSGEIARYALFSLIRSALEEAARAAWLLDPEIGDQLRLARGMTERLTNLIEVQKLGYVAHAKTRIADLDKVALREGLSRMKDKKKGRDLDAFGSEVRPEATRLLASLLPEREARSNGLTLGEFAYRSLSGRSHGALWALIANAQPIGRPGPRIMLAAIAADIDELLDLLSVAVQLHDVALGRLAGAVGKDKTVEIPSLG